MSLNTSIVLLDPPQIAQRVYDSTNDSIRVNIGDVNGISFSLSALAGDSVTSYARSVSQKASITSASTGTVIASFDIRGMANINLYTNTTSTITGAQSCIVQVSPSDTDNVWVNTSLTITPSLTNAAVVMATAINNVFARRARVVIASAITSGTFDIYAVAQGG